ncbi:DUF1674 domain-containing protein [Aliiroseovarius marinus]|uniref:DUF1674 domain-containing protein n=1 Tax=Aliiroseovarius marinus TaxID=2500159 RepID=UPI003D7CDB58
MSDDHENAAPTAEDEKRDLPPAALRALAEAEERRKKAAAEAKEIAKEYGGRDGPEPVRFGDWEKKGIAIDF